MIPTATFTTVLVAALSVNAAPIFSGFFAPRAVRPAPVQRRDLSATQLAQGTNHFFGSLYLEAECTPGQVACIGGMTATCSPEANWETLPCAEDTTCYAVPATSDEADDSLVVTCMSQDEATAALGTQDLSIDFQITTAPLNSTVTELPGSGDSPSDSIEEPEPTPTESEPAPESSCIPDEDEDDEEEEEEDEESDEPSDDSSVDPVNDFTQTLGGEIPTPTEEPTSTCTEEPEEAEFTEYITVIAFPHPTNPAEYSYSTLSPTETALVSEAVPAPTESSDDEEEEEEEEPIPTDEPTEYEPAPSDLIGSDANVSPTDSSSSVECTETPYSAPYEDPAGTEVYQEPAPTESSGEEVAPTDPAVSSPPLDIGVIGTHLTPASATPVRRGMVKLARRA